MALPRTLTSPITTQVLEDALLEAETIKAKHDGVHDIHNTVSLLGTYVMWARRGDLDKDAACRRLIEKDFPTVMARARYIGRTGQRPP